MSSVGGKRHVKVVSASSFYDAQILKRQKGTHQNPAATLPVSCNRHQQQPCRRFNPLNAPYKAFRTQKEAFEFLDKQPCSQILRTFARELSATGQREFIVSSAELFWQHYKALAADDRHHYEIIRQSSPCHLYFDLEYVPKVNPDVDGPSLVQLLVSGVAAQLHQQYHIHWEDSYVLELDSSTTQKFSRHLVVRLPGIAFADACQAGRFARLVVLRLLQKGAHSSKHGQLLVQEKDGTGLISFVDMGVYTRNRAFRLYLSSKYGKQARLRLTPRFGGASVDPKAAFGQLLISVLHSSSSSVSNKVALALTPLQDQQGPWFKGNITTHHCSRRFGNSTGSVRPAEQQQQSHVSLLYVDDIDWQLELQQLPSSWQQVAMLQLNPVPHHQQLLDQPPTLTPSQQQRSSRGPRAGASWVMQQAPAAAAVAGPTVCYGLSPYPMLEQFILSICNQGGVQGGIRSWLALPGCMLYSIKNNRWCGNIERPHKSNGVYYVADLSTGVYYQKCYDPTCRSYRSPCLPLPLKVWELYRQDRITSNPAAADTAAHGGTAAAAAEAAAAVGVLGRELHWRQQQEQSDADDDMCLQLLQEFEAQHQKQELQLC